MSDADGSGVVRILVVICTLHCTTLLSCIRSLVGSPFSLYLELITRNGMEYTRLKFIVCHSREGDWFRNSIVQNFLYSVTFIFSVSSIRRSFHSVVPIVADFGYGLIST
jgi:hypothetical protein